MPYDRLKEHVVLSLEVEGGSERCAVAMLPDITLSRA